MAIDGIEAFSPPSHPSSHFSQQRHFYVAVDRLQFKMETLVGLLDVAGRRPSLPMIVCCSSRDELDAVCSAVSNLQYISLASLYSDLAEADRALILETFRQTTSRWSQKLNSLSDDKCEVEEDGEKSHMIVVTDACLPLLASGESPLSAHVLINYELPTKKETYMRRMTTCSASDGILINMVVGGEVVTLKSIEESSGLVIAEMPINKFIELLRKGTAEDRDLAIQCLRTALAPCALDAYPEAYEEFKHVLLAFIYDKDNQTSPVTYEWSERRRFDIAGLMSSVLRAHMQAYDPVFSMTLRYLISIHKGFCFHEGVSSPISDLTERLLLDELDPPATPKESLYEAPPFDEVDIQALAHAVELTRQGAIDSLRFTKGDLFHAFQNELCRMKLDLSVLDELVREYCIYRGIVDSGCGVLSGMQNLSSSSKVNQSELEYCSSRNTSFEVDYATSKLSDGEISVSNSRVDSSPENIADVTSSQSNNEVELRYASEPTSNREDCSTSDSVHVGNSRTLQANKNRGIVERSKRKRWRGRHDDRELHDVSYSGCSKAELSAITVASMIMSKEQQNLEKHIPIDSTGREDKYEIVLGIRELASKRLAAEVVEEINALDPNFFVQNPILLFQLKQVEFLKLVSSGDYSSALRVACTHLGPLAANEPSLLKQLKETLLALLLPNEDFLGKGFPVNALANSLQVAFGRRLGIEEPRLMKLMRATVHSHSEWFKLQMCKDRFESLLKIDSLKEVNLPSLSTSGALLKSNSDSCIHGSSQVAKSSAAARTSEDGSSPMQASSIDAGDENAILKVMEFLALPRADAIHLLAQYNGNAEMVIQQIFA